jgi:hypothetical protein
VRQPRNTRGQAALTATVLRPKQAGGYAKFRTAQVVQSTTSTRDARSITFAARSRPCAALVPDEPPLCPRSFKYTAEGKMNTGLDGVLGGWKAGGAGWKARGAVFERFRRGRPAGRSVERVAGLRYTYRYPNARTGQTPDLLDTRNPDCDDQRHHKYPHSQHLYAGEREREYEYE